MEGATLERLHDALLAKKVNGGAGLKKGTVLTEELLAGLERSDWFKLRMEDSALNDQIEKAEQGLAERKKLQEDLFEDKRKKIQGGDDLAPGVLKVVKVYLAVKRRVQPGDKMAGRHGNKGVISVIMPMEDMPHDREW